MELLKNNKEGRKTILDLLSQHEDEEITIPKYNDGFVVEINGYEKFMISEKLFNFLVEHNIITKL